MHKNVIRRSILFILLIVNTTSVWAGNKISDYYKYIYLAEQDVIAVNYKNAALNYDKAFATGMVPFAIDMHNNMQVGINTADNGRVLKMAKLLIIKGVDTGYFRKSMFSSFRRSNEWGELLKAYPALKKQNEHQVDKKLVKHLQEMDDKDQDLTHASYENPNDTAVIRGANALYNECRHLMLKNDFLSEEKVGIKTEDTEITFIAPFAVLIVHSFEDHSSEEKDTSVLFIPVTTAISKGKLKSDVFLSIFNVCNQVNYLSDFYEFKDTLFNRFHKNRIYEKGKPYLVSEKPRPIDIAFARYLYVDNYENMTRKLKFAFENRCQKKREFLMGFGVDSFGGAARDPSLRNDTVIATCP